jgi:hypothetical protein
MTIFLWKFQIFPISIQKNPYFRNKNPIFPLKIGQKVASMPVYTKTTYAMDNNCIMHYHITTTTGGRDSFICINLFPNMFSG